MPRGCIAGDEPFQNLKNPEFAGRFARARIKNMARGWGAQIRENATERRKYATKDEQVLMAQVGLRNRGITTGTGVQIGEQISKLHWQSH